MPSLSPNTTHTTEDSSTQTARIFRPIELDVKEVHHAYLDRVLACFYSLAGGVIFGTVFIDILPHIQVLEEKYKKEYGLEHKFPVNYCLVCIGFLLTYFFEEGTHEIADYDDKWKKLNDEDRQLRKEKRKKSANVAVAALTFIFAMSIQGFVEGVTLLQNTTSRIIELLMALILAKLVGGLTTGRNKEAKREKVVSIITAIIVFALVIPFGSAIGAFINRYEITETRQDAVKLIFESMAGGLFIYVALIEIIHKQKKGRDSILHLWIIFFGVTLVGILHLSFGTIVLRAAGGSEEEDYPELFNKSPENDY